MNGLRPVSAAAARDSIFTSESCKRLQDSALSVLP